MDNNIIYLFKIIKGKVLRTLLERESLIHANSKRNDLIRYKNDEIGCFQVCDHGDEILSGISEIKCLVRHWQSKTLESPEFCPELKLAKSASDSLWNRWNLIKIYQKATEIYEFQLTVIIRSYFIFCFVLFCLRRASFFSLVAIFEYQFASFRSTFL